ncbi:MAG: TetR/AcrR family transcriptional regulator, partial [Angelakisella sp.]
MSTLPSQRLREYSEAKKNEKREKLERAGYDLFLSKGIHDTSIDDIVKGASVAKGTFYLYFK